ncbi:Na+/H+ antiporter family protein [[Clostridium] methylpentosum DSM 5476]|uniref:Na+/H+ antiporter family protein n=1 Tax=[Clostridium] methylpentosum DSM 5476 TaxID=537013 RepID=C0EG72_9FIRM|nr:Na+/H+ antiporter family protein [[Clostridium] methylpentosum DSM 5476]MEE1491825.1 Na+/H+ antiporter NhaC family protein [Massilioclostridium sp.]
MKKGNWFALLPIVVFLLLFVGSGILTGDFYTIPAVVGFLIALAVALCQNRTRSFQEKLTTACKGAGDETILTMVLIFILAGAFSGVVKAAGGVESTVNFGLSVIPPNLAVVGIFIVACFISLSMGTSMGTIASLAPIAAGVADKTGLPVALCIGAVVCGAMFGDNLSMISDTTIAAVKTQGCKMNDKFKQNFLIVLPAAVITALILAWRTSNVSYQITGDLHYNFLQIVPYLVVLIGALIGFNVFAVLTAGIVTSSIVGISLGSFTFGELFGKIGEGIESMYEIAVISLLVSGVVALVKHNGGIQYMIDLIKRHVKTRKGAELGMAGISAVVDVCTANNTVAIVMAGGIVKEIGDEFDVPPKRAASILDIFTSMVQGLIPYGAQLLTAASLVKITPFDIIPNLYYPILMGVSALLWILLAKRKEDAPCQPSKQM